jgi:hypothetical protein
MQIGEKDKVTDDLWLLLLRKRQRKKFLSYAYFPESVNSRLRKRFYMSLDL